MTKLPVLIVDDDRNLLEALCVTLRLAGHTALAAADGEAALALLRTRHVGLVVTDVQMKPMDGLTLLQKIKVLDPALPVLLMTAYGEIEKAVAAMRGGACDYLLKPFEPAILLAQVGRYLLAATDHGTAGVIASDPRTIELLALAQRVAKSGATVMLTGESGSGKEVLARFIHQHSPRAAQPFVAINCAAIPENLLEATLFGYEKGAFTGAVQAQAGKFEQAQGGTLLLDEISEMPLALQAKLLRVLQEREIERVGGAQDDCAGYPGACHVQSRPSGPGCPRRIPRGIVLPAERVSDRDPAAAGAPAGYRAVGAARSPRSCRPAGSEQRCAE